MINTEIKKKLINDLSKLPFDLQKKVRDFAHALLLTQPKGSSGKELLRFAGTMSGVEAQKMIKSIDEGCEKVDRDEW